MNFYRVDQTGNNKWAVFRNDEECAIVIGFDNEKDAIICKNALVDAFQAGMKYQAWRVKDALDIRS